MSTKKCCDFVLFRHKCAKKTCISAQAARQAQHPPASLFYLKGVWSLRNLPPRAASVQINRPYRSHSGSSAASGSAPSYSARP